MVNSITKVRDSDILQFWTISCLCDYLEWSVSSCRVSTHVELRVDFQIKDRAIASPKNDHRETLSLRQPPRVKWQSVAEYFIFYFVAEEIDVALIKHLDKFGFELQHSLSIKLDVSIAHRVQILVNWIGAE